MLLCYSHMSKLKCKELDFTFSLPSWNMMIHSIEEFNAQYLGSKYDTTVFRAVNQKGCYLLLRTTSWWYRYWLCLTVNPLVYKHVYNVCPVKLIWTNLWHIEQQIKYLALEQWQRGHQTFRWLATHCTTVPAYGGPDFVTSYMALIYRTWRQEDSKVNAPFKVG